MKRIGMGLLAVLLALLCPLQVLAAGADVRLVSNHQDLMLIGRVVKNADVLELEPVYYLLSSASLGEARVPAYPTGNVQVEKPTTEAYSYLAEGDMALASLDLQQDGTCREAWGIYPIIDATLGAMEIEYRDQQGRELIEGFLNRGTLYDGESRQQVEAFMQSGQDYGEARAMLIPAGEARALLENLPPESDRNERLWYYFGIGAAIFLAVLGERKLRAAKAQDGEKE